MRLAHATCCIVFGIGWLACGDDDSGCPNLEWEVGTDGHADPLGASAMEARAGRISGAALPPTERGLEMWEDGDFVLANDRVAVVIEDAGDSQLYDPWGGRPVGFARVVSGELVEPSEFGEIFVLAGQYTVVTRNVSVVNDGSDGGAAVVRASGFLAPLPFTVPLLADLFLLDLGSGDVSAAIDYVLEPGAEHVDVILRFRSQRDDVVTVDPVLHAFMYMERIGNYTAGRGFGGGGKAGDYIVLTDDDATSVAYQVPEQRLAGGVAISGFVSNFADPYDVAACSETEHLHARLTIGGPGLEPVQQALARAKGTAQRTISGVVRDADGATTPGVRVHAVTEGGTYITRVRTDEQGAYQLAIDDGIDVELYAWERGRGLVGPVSADADTVDFAFAPTGFIHVTASEQGGAAELPVRVQVFPRDQELVDPPESFGEAEIVDGRLHVEYVVSGVTTVEVPAGEWEVVVSRGFEYEIYTEIVDVAAGATVDVAAVLERSVDTTDFMCADFHIHTLRSPDSGDDPLVKVMSAISDGLEIPVRSDHDYINSFDPEIATLGMEAWAFPISSVELTSMQTWGHMGVFPLTADPSQRNNGAPRWIDYPDESDMSKEVAVLPPVPIFESVRARPERSVLIINHPLSTGNDYFEHVGLDPITGLVDHEDDWDESFRLVEVFNGSSWLQNLDSTVKAWMALLGTGRTIFAVGSSDSHGISREPVGYPRTCLDVGTDSTSELTADLVRDAAFEGASVISGGVFITASVGGAGPGENTSGSSVDIVVQAPTWVDVDTLEVVVDGEIVALEELGPEDADIDNPAIRYQGSVAFTPAAGGSFVIVAAYGSERLAPVHPKRSPFGVSNPIFVSP